MTHYGLFAFTADLDRGEVLVELWVQGGQLINGAVESAVVVTEDLTQEEGGKRNIHNYALDTQTLKLHIQWKFPEHSAGIAMPISFMVYLVNGFSEHLSHKLKELQVVFVDVRCGWRIQPFIPTGGLHENIKKGFTKSASATNRRELIQPSLLKPHSPWTGSAQGWRPF